MAITLRHQQSDSSLSVIEDWSPTEIDSADGQQQQHPEWKPGQDEEEYLTDSDTGMKKRHFLKRVGVAPNTMEYHLDLCLARVAKKNPGTIIPQMCLMMQQWRENNTVDDRSQYRFISEPDADGVDDVQQALADTQAEEPGKERGRSRIRSPREQQGARTQIEHALQAETLKSTMLTPPETPTFARKPRQDLGPLVKIGGGSVARNPWDLLLREVVRSSNEMHTRRRWKMKGKNREAKWAVWERRQRLRSRTRFVADEENGYAVGRGVLDANGYTRGWSMQLGYRREEERELGEHWVTVEEMWRETFNKGGLVPAKYQQKFISES